jgi:hypothetical protein
MGNGYPKLEMWLNVCISECFTMQETTDVMGDGYPELGHCLNGPHAWQVSAALLHLSASLVHPLVDLGASQTHPRCIPGASLGVSPVCPLCIRGQISNTHPLHSKGLLSGSPCTNHSPVWLNARLNGLPAASAMHVGARPVALQCKGDMLASWLGQHARMHASVPRTLPHLHMSILISAVHTNNQLLSIGSPLILPHCS